MRSSHPLDRMSHEIATLSLDITLNNNCCLTGCHMNLSWTGHHMRQWVTPMRSLTLTKDKIWDEHLYLYPIFLRRSPGETLVTDLCNLHVVKGHGCQQGGGAVLDAGDQVVTPWVVDVGTMTDDQLDPLSVVSHDCEVKVTLLLWHLQRLQCWNIIIKIPGRLWGLGVAHFSNTQKWVQLPVSCKTS